MKIAAIKSYASTRKAYMEGVPRLLDILDECRSKASFYFGMGKGSGLRQAAMGQPAARSPEHKLKKLNTHSVSS